MGRIPFLKSRKLISLTAGLGLLAPTALAQPTSQAVQQTYPIVSLNTELARDADTYTDDKALVETCTDKGQTKTTCLCVTHVLKYELTLSEYKAAVRLYGATSNTIDASLRHDGIAAQDIQTARDVMRDLTQTRDFGERCQEAKAYYHPQ